MVHEEEKGSAFEGSARYYGQESRQLSTATTTTSTTSGPTLFYLYSRIFHSFSLYVGKPPAAALTEDEPADQS